MENGYEPEIDLKGLLFYILYKWRSILAVAVIFCILVSGYKILRGISGDTAGEVTSKDSREYEIALAEYELNVNSYERSILDYQKRLEQQKRYMEKSILMEVNPYEKPTASADVFIKLDETEWEILPDIMSVDPTDSLIKVYVSNFASTIDWAPIESLTGQDALYLEELLSVWADYNSNTFTIAVVYSDGATAQQILDLILKQVMERYQGMAADVSKHTLSVVNQSLSYTIDHTLANSQKNNADTLTSYELSIIDCRKELEELADEEPVPPSSGSGIKKYALVGFAAGIFLMSVFYGMSYILDGKLHTKYELTNKYNYQLLGIVPRPKRKRFLCAIDHLLERLDGTARLPAKEEAYRIIAANIINLAGKYRNTLIVGTLDTKKLKEITEALTPLLAGITFITAENMNVTADSLKELAECDSVILVEERHVSFMEDIQRQQECIASLNKAVVGYIILL